VKDDEIGRPTIVVKSNKKIQHELPESDEDPMEARKTVAIVKPQASPTKSVKPRLVEVKVQKFNSYSQPP